jgi:hypothetical protein
MTIAAKFGTGTKRPRRAPYDCRATLLLRARMRKRRETATDLSRDLRCSPQFAKKIVEGQVDPRARHMFLLRTLAGIPLEAWNLEKGKAA